MMIPDSIILTQIPKAIDIVVDPHCVIKHIAMQIDSNKEII